MMTRAWGLAAVLLTGICVMTVSRAGETRHEAGQKPETFIKIGPYRINTSRINFTRDDQKDLVIGFADSERNELRLTGAEAEAMRVWLDQKSVDISLKSRIPEDLRDYQVPPHETQRRLRTPRELR